MDLERENQEWVEALQSEGASREAALSDLRAALMINLKKALRSRPDFLDSMLEDFVQDSLLRVLKSLDQFEQRSRFLTWATAIAIRVGLTELRKRQWRDVSLDRLVTDSGFEPPASEENGSESSSQPIIDAMYRIIGTELTDRQRTVLLAEIKGMPQEVIVRQMGTNRNALYKLGHDARKRLKAGLENAGFKAEDFVVAMNGK